MPVENLINGWSNTLGVDRKQFDLFFDKMMDGFAYNKVILDGSGKPIDFIILEVNRAFEHITGLKREKVLGKRATKVLNGFDQDPVDWIGTYGRVALNGEPTQFENYAQGLDKWLKISAYSPQKGYFVSLFEDITERKKSEQKLRQAKNDWERTFDSDPDLIAIIDNKHKIVRANRAMAEQLGITPEQAIGLTCYRAIHHTESPPQFCPHAKTLQDGREHIEEVYEPRLGGYFVVSTTPLKDEKGQLIGSVHVARNITERKQTEEALKRSEEQLRKLNRTLRAISNSNQALMHITDEKTFLQEGCRVLVEDCGYKMVWIGYVKDDEAKSVVPVAYAGFDRGYLESLKVTWADVERGRGPLGLAIRTGKPQFCNDMRTDSSFRPWREEALKRGYASSIVIPLKSEGKIFGAITMYAAEPNRCSEDEVKLLTELGDDFSYGIRMLRLREASERAEKERKIMVEFLLIANQSLGTNKLISSATDFFKQKSGCKSAGIRLKNDDNYPYEEAEGFSVEHIELEKLYSYGNKGRILRDFVESPILECICENVISGTFDPKKEFFTEKGSFWTNSMTQLLATTNYRGIQTSTRNRCNSEGYESVALIPLRVGRKPLGLIQLNDVRKDIFTVENIQMWERIADHLALALSKSIAEETALSRAKELQRIQQKLVEKSEEVEKYASKMEELAEERLIKLKESERLAAIGATAGMVGHDIRNPLQAITGDLYLAKQELSVLPESGKKSAAIESLGEIEKNVDYINKIVQDLQDFARPLNPKAEESDIKLVIESLIAKNSLPDNIKIKVRVADEDRKIKADAYYINRILYNLITNSIQAMPQGGKITIDAHKEADVTVLSVQDTGVGIPTNIQDKVFTLMFTTKSKGQGFGLPVVKRMTEALGGTVTFDSQEDKGTTFIVRLPTTKSR